MVLLDICTHDRQPYMAKDFNTQKGYSFILDLEDDKDKSRYVETGIYLHWQDSEIVDIAVDISCMCGCALACKFCSSSGFNNGILSAEQMVAQAVFSLNYIKACEGDFYRKCEKITFSFEGMGEPSLCGSAVADAIPGLRNEFAKAFATVQFIISTTAADSRVIKNWADCKEIRLQSLQISLHAPTDEQRKALIGSHIAMDSIQDILANLAYFHTASPDTQIKINYLVIAGRNDSPEDAAALLNIVKDTPYYLKLSHLNETNVTRKNALKNPEAGVYRKFLDACKKGHERTYEYGVLQSIHISCGQLAAYADGNSKQVLNNRSIREVHEKMVDEDVILFLGAGANSTFESSKQLANELYEKLFANDSDQKERYRDIRDNLTEVADCYKVGRTNDMYTYIHNILSKTKYPAEFLEIPKHPWNAIYTTNYDSCVEDAYQDALDRKATDCQCVRIVDQKDLAQTIPHNAVPLIKLHGGNKEDISQDVISSIDYLNNYEGNRQYLFKMLESDFLRHTIVFAGYSFKDHYLAQLLYNANRVLLQTGKKSYAVLPWNDQMNIYGRILKEKFGIELIGCTFEDFLKELARLRKSLKVFVSGSKKASIPNAARRTNYGERIDAFCRILGEKMNHEGVTLITGATATDKVGYLVARHLKEANVRTYYFHGSEKIAKNEISKMIGCVEYGMQVIDIINKTISVCNVAIFIGGASICLEEIMQAMSSGKMIIPIRVGDQEYASDIIHTYIKNNLDMVARFESDSQIMPPNRAHRYFNEYLNNGVIDRLVLRTNNAEAVAETVMELLRRFRMNS